MPKTTHRLTAVELKNLKASGLHPDGAGLYLKVAGSSKSWVFRYMLDGRARYLGLGSALGIPLAEARSLAAKARELVRLGCASSGFSGQLSFWAKRASGPSIWFSRYGFQM
jgi:hypothetical protein